MCGRFTLTQAGDALMDALGIPELPAPPDEAPRYNVAPSQRVLALVPTGDGDAPEWTHLEWGLVPFWAREDPKPKRLINARAESVADKPTFRESFRERRCLIPADGYFEWHETEHGKLPHHVRFDDWRVFAFAGLYASRRTDEGVATTCAIVTTTPTPALEALHDRMPLILDRERHAAWLDVSEAGTAAATEALGEHPADELVWSPVSRRVNAPTQDGPACLEPYDAAEQD